MKLRPAQRMLVQLARDIQDGELRSLMDLTGAQAGVKEKFDADAIGYFMYLKGKHRTLSGFLDSLKDALRGSELESLYSIVDKHDRNYKEDDLSWNPSVERLGSCRNGQQRKAYAETMLKMGKYVVKKDVDIMKAVAPLNEGIKSDIAEFTDLCSKMKDCGCISENNVEFLRDLLSELRRAEALRLLDEYENNNQTLSRNPDFHHSPHPFHRQHHVTERPGPSPNSGHNSRSYSAPEGFSHTSTSNCSTASEYFTPQSNSRSQSRADLLRRTVSVPQPGRLAGLREQLNIPHDPIYPGGMSVFQIPTTAFTSQMASRQAPAVPPVGSSDVEPSAPLIDENVIGQANPSASDAQVIVNRQFAGINNWNDPSALRGAFDNRGCSSNLPNLGPLNAEEQSSLSTFDSNPGFPAPISREHTGPQNMPNHSNSLERPAQGRYLNEEMSSASTYASDIRFTRPQTRQNTGMHAMVGPSLTRIPPSQASQPAHTNNPPRIEEGLNSSHLLGLHSNQNIGGAHNGRFDSRFNSSLRSSEVAGLGSRSLGGATLSESGNVVGHPSSSSETSGMLPSGGLYPVLPTLVPFEEGQDRRNRKRSHVDIQSEDKRIKTEECIESEEEDFSTPPESPVAALNR